ncbi:hypothetical protein BDV3_004863 [Batrachochytrium dendrobatidis]|uniref:GH16 domain-containing protein n=1 Tax=Batrachochytrium dendrobatidis (strain JEL423) TaxID=403673 RepID=A0A177WKY5_BATDL|nr:hypothetical protein O5D80_006971 [Batrachochytrium dendrobatidis]KAK5670976.1 hypothetical protein QVD99_002748 [Batrachochytrium dendrobatidis]OAJ40344.1 hypothetical protein BDEG_24088 [Batrachochytrium dendrobatidis JEL423]
MVHCSKLIALLKVVVATSLSVVLAQVGKVNIPPGFKTGNCLSGRLEFNEKRIFRLHGDETKKYDVDRAAYDFTHSYGSMTYGTNGSASLNLVKNADPSKLADGVLVSTTRYLRYGKITAKLNPAKSPGIVTTLVTWSDRQAPIPNSSEYTQDEIDWEFLGKDVSRPETNVFTYKTSKLERGLHGGPIDSVISPGAHEYTIDWKNDRILWQVDGRTVKTLLKSESHGQPGSLPPGEFWFPESASRVQVSIWDGTTQGSWTGGPIQYDQNGIVSSVYEYIDIQCYDDNMNPVSTWSTDGTGAAQPEAPRSTAATGVSTGGNSGTTGTIVTSGSASSPGSSSAPKKSNGSSIQYSSIVSVLAIISVGVTALITS